MMLPKKVLTQYQTWKYWNPFCTKSPVADSFQKLREALNSFPTVFFLNAPAMMPKNNPQDWKEKCWCFSLCRVFQWRVRDVRSQWNLICNIDVRFFTFQAFLLAACLWQNLFWPVGLLFSFGLGMSAFCGVFVKKPFSETKWGTQIFPDRVFA